MHGKLFGRFIINARTYRYNITCSIGEHEKEHQSSSDDVIRVGGFPLLKNSTTEALYLLGETIDFIDCWLKASEHNFIEICNLYSHHMDLVFQIYPVKLPNQPSPKKKRKSLLHDIGVG